MASKKVRLERFQHSVTKSYILEFGEYYIRFYTGGAQIKVGGVPVEVTTPYVEADLFELDCRAVSINTMYIFHEDYPIGKLVRTSDTVWAYSTTTCGGKFPNANNYPACGCLFEQRLWAFGTIATPNGAWASKVGAANYEDFALDAENPSAGLDFTVLIQGADQARWAYPEHGIYIGTISGVIFLYSGGQGEAISQENINVIKLTSLGTNSVAPEMVDDAIVFASRMGTTLRRLILGEGGRISVSSLTRIASHITLGTSLAISGVTQFAFQRDPYPILWAVKKDGQLLGMTYDIQDKIYGWFRVKLDGVVESVAVSGADGEEDQVWIVIKRNINGVDKRYVEYFMPYHIFSTIANAFFVESGLSYSGVSTTTISGLAHLNGEVVYCLGTTAAGSGRVQGPYTVAAGQITLGTAITYGHIGKLYDSTLEPMKLHITTDQGTVKGRRQKCNKITISLYETGQGVQVGPDTSNLKSLFLGESEPAVGKLFTGDVHYDFDGDWDDNVTIVLRQSQPLPMTVLSIIPRFVTEDED